MCVGKTFLQLANDNLPPNVTVHDPSLLSRFAITVGYAQTVLFFCPGDTSGRVQAEVDRS